MTSFTGLLSSRSSMGERLDRLPTGAKVFLILSAALLPLAIIAFFATLSTTQRATQEARARLRVAVSESSRALGIELVGDVTALTSTMNALGMDSKDAPSCARARGVFAQQTAAGARFMILDGTGRLLCGWRLPQSSVPRAASGMATAAAIVPNQGVVLSAAGGKHVRGAAFFPTQFLADVARPTAFDVDHESKLIAPDGGGLIVRALNSDDTFDRYETMRASLGVAGLTYEIRMRVNTLTSPVVLALVLPILMWGAAATIAWFTVDRFVVEPVRVLRDRVAAFSPGEEIDVGEIRAVPATEIRELGDAFEAISRTLATHEHGLAEGLVRQTKLTREVHHRVKNNLQVIASLISLHARGASTFEAAQAYASIQRRVDALAVVHRHHFAEMEDNRGLSLRSVIGELASNIRATVPDGTPGPVITIAIEPYLVNQDVGVAVAFLLTELVELAMSVASNTHVRLSLNAGTDTRAARLRVSSPDLIDGEILRDRLGARYGRVIEGLSRQLRSKLEYEPLVGAYEIVIATLGRD